MPKGTKVHRCVEKVKAKGGDANPYAVCQSSTGQSYTTGKKKRKSDGKKVGSPKESAIYKRLQKALKERNL